MGRPLPSCAFPMQIRLGTFLPATVTSLLVILTVVLPVFSVVIFLCGSHTGMVKSLQLGKEEKKKTVVRLGGENKNKRGVIIERMKSSLSSKALLMSKMISWRKVQAEDHLQDDDDEVAGDQDGVVWKKTIIRGEKCRPLDFSGKILYDSDGNLLPD